MLSHVFTYKPPSDIWNNAPPSDHCQHLLGALELFFFGQSFIMSANQKDPQYKLRWSEELRDKVAASAKAYNRSMNADIVARLERSFQTESDFSPLKMPPEDLANRLQAIAEEKNKNSSEKVVISREYLNDLLEIKSTLKNLSLAVLDLEKHTIDFEAEDFVEKVTQNKD